MPAGYLPVQAGAVKATEAQLFVPAVAVPIVGAPGAAGQMFCARAWNCSVVFQIPEKLGITGPPYWSMGTSELYPAR
jgi:hypothetical protein